jgi:uncharacterized protein (TIRG00374 family)
LRFASSKTRNAKQNGDCLDRKKDVPVTRKALGNLFKYCLAFGLLAWVIAQFWLPGSDRGIEYIWNKHVVRGEPIRYGYLLLGLLLISTGITITLIRWYFLVRAQGLPFHIKDAFRLGLLGVFFNTFLPGSVGGDIVKAAGIARGQRRRMVAVATVIMDRVIAVWAMIWMVALLGILFWVCGVLDGPSSAGARRIVRVASIVVAASAVVWVLLGYLPQQRAEHFAVRLHHIPRIGNSAAEFWRAVWMYRCRQGSVLLALVLTWLGQVGFILGFYCGVLTLWDPKLGSVPSVAEHFLLVPIGLLIEAVPLFPGGVGIGEAGYAGLYTLFGCTAAMGALGSLVKRMLQWFFALVGFFLSQRLQPVTVCEPESQNDAGEGTAVNPLCERSPAA